MKIISKLFLALRLIIYTNILFMSNVGLAMDITVEPSPVKPARKVGQSKVSGIEEVVRVKSCITLGDSCTQQMADLVKEADEFVVAFMYRFNAPNLITALADKYIESSMPVLVFLDYDQSIGSEKYHGCVKHLVENVPTSLVKLGSGAFHHKVLIFKKKGQQAFVSIGSANTTHDSDNKHSEDSLIIQSNEVGRFYLKEFQSLLRTSKSGVYHEHKIYNKKTQRSESNTSKLGDLVNLLMHNDVMNTDFGQEGTVTSMAVSAGSSVEGNECLDIVHSILSNNENKALILFENYLTLKQREYSDFWSGLLQKDIPKLIVLDDNENNTSAIKQISHNDGITSLIFRPYTSGEFHHKLIIQHLVERGPIIYTGSFNLSNNAVTKNSESIIGVSSEGLDQDYIASILWQSDLGNQIKVLNFIKKKNACFINPNNSEDKIMLVIQKILDRNKMNMNRYSYRFEGMIKKMYSLNKDVKSHTEKAMNDGKNSLNLRLTSFNELSADEKLLFFLDGRNLIFCRPLSTPMVGSDKIALPNTKKNTTSPINDPRFNEIAVRSKNTPTYSRKRAASSGSLSSSAMISRPTQTLEVSSFRGDKFEDSVFNSCYNFILEKIKIISSSVSNLTPFPQPVWKGNPEKGQITKWLYSIEQYIEKIESKIGKIESQFKGEIEEENELRKIFEITEKKGKLKTGTSIDYDSKKAARLAINDLKFVYSFLWEAYDYPESFRALQLLGKTLEDFNIFREFDY